MYKNDSVWAIDFFETYKKSSESKKLKSKKHTLVARKKLDTIMVGYIENQHSRHTRQLDKTKEEGRNYYK